MESSYLSQEEINQKILEFDDALENGDNRKAFMIAVDLAFNLQDKKAFSYWMYEAEYTLKEDLGFPLPADWKYYDDYFRLRYLRRIKQKMEREEI